MMNMYACVAPKKENSANVDQERVVCVVLEISSEDHCVPIS